MREAVEPKPGTDGTRTKPPSKEEGDEREIPTGIQLPVWKPIHESEWKAQTPPFDQYTALRIKNAGLVSDSEAGEQKDVYDFFINVDNLHLKRFLKYELKTGEDQRVTRTRFEVGMILVGLAIIHENVRERKNSLKNSGEEQSEVNVEDQVDAATKALAPFLLPMIDALGSLDEEQTVASVASGEAT